MSPISRQGDRRIESRRESERLMHYATQALLAAALAEQDCGTSFELDRAIDAYRAAEAALLAEAT